MPEILFILVLALLIFGPKKLPEIGRTLGRGLGEFRRATNDLKRTFDADIRALENEVKEPPAKVEPAVPPAAGPPANTVQRSSAEGSAEPVETTSTRPLAEAATIAEFESDSTASATAAEDPTDPA